MYLLFAGEQHGFRKAENIRAALDGELSFYAQVWGFGLPAEEDIQPIELKDPPTPHRSQARGGTLQEGL